MAQGSRPERIADQIRAEIGRLLTQEIKDPGVGFVTLTSVRVTADLQLARVYYTVLGDERQRRDTARALARVTPFARRHVAARLRLRRAPELVFHYDESVERQERVERILRELQDAPQPDSDPGDEPQ